MSDPAGTIPGVDFAETFGPPPRRTVPIEWAAVEGWLGLTLPGSYKAIASAYGPLDIGEYVWLHVPCVQDGDFSHFNWGRWLTNTHRSTRIASRDAPPHEPPPFHPAPGGLLAWGTTRRSDELFWDTSGPDPDRWPVVIFHRDAADQKINPWQRYETPLPETLAAFVGDGLPLPGGGRLGPLPATAVPTAFLPDARPWQPPPPVTIAQERRAAVTEGSGLAALTALVPPPDRPYLGGGDWDSLFDRLGTRLPAEYVALMDRYGGGIWAEWLRFRTPLRDGFLADVTEMLDVYRQCRADWPEEHPLPAWPEPGGFLPFACSIDGDEFGWLAEGDPDAWPLIVYPRHADQGPPLPAGLIDTLLDWLRGKYSTDGLVPLDRDDDPVEFATFESWTDDSYW